MKIREAIDLFKYHQQINRRASGPVRIKNRGITKDQGFGRFGPETHFERTEVGAGIRSCIYAGADSQEATRLHQGEEPGSGGSAIPDLPLDWKGINPKVSG